MLRNSSQPWDLYSHRDDTQVPSVPLRSWPCEHADSGRFCGLRRCLYDCLVAVLALRAVLERSAAATEVRDRQTLLQKWKSQSQRGRRLGSDAQLLGPDWVPSAVPAGSCSDVSQAPQLGCTSSRILMVLALDQELASSSGIDYNAVGRVALGAADGPGHLCLC